MRNPDFAKRYHLELFFSLIDVFITFCAAYIAYYLRFEHFEMPIQYRLVVAFVSLILVIVFLVCGIYDSWRGRSLIKQLLKLLGCWFIAFAILGALLIVTQQNIWFSRWWMGLWFAVGFCLNSLFRVGLFLFLRELRRRGKNVKPVAVIGKGEGVTKIQGKSESHLEYGFKVVKTIDLSQLDQEKNLHDILQELFLQDLHEIWICLPLKDGDLLKGLLFELSGNTAEIRYFPGFDDLRLLNHKVTYILGMYALDLSCTPIEGVNSWVKWLEDNVLGLLISILILPLCLLITVAIKLTSPGPVLFKQYRNGVGGKKFKVYKFRTMEVHKEEDGKVTPAVKGDPRVTKVGAFLRKTSLDELPQFFNVLQGRMSIVGPRPHALSHNEYYKELVESYMWRHKVKPGITGWAQVNGYRGEINTLNKLKNRVQHDLWYIENWSLFLDLKIILWTIFNGFTGKNAY